MEVIDFDEHDNFKHTLTLTEAAGTIAPVEYDQATIDVVEGLMYGEFHVSTNKNTVCKCIDGRDCEDGLEGPNSAGGSLSLLVADDLTDRQFINAEEPLDVGMERLVTDFTERGIPIGMHTDTHADEHSDKSGCGANDSIQKIYGILVDKADLMRNLTETILETTIDDAAHDSIIQKAAQRVEFSTGKKVHAAATRLAEEETTEKLVGDHNEIVAILNKRSGTTLDRSTLSPRQAFNIDVWAFEESAREISGNGADILTPKVFAMMYYNIATAHALCGPSMKVGILK